MNAAYFRSWLYFTLVDLRGLALRAAYHRFLNEYQSGIPEETSKNLLVLILEHCNQHVPYYREAITRFSNDFHQNPMEYLRNFPILDKRIIRKNFDELKSADLADRNWYFNTTGGSTGEPARFIQDREYAAKSGAITLLFSKLAGREIGELEIQLWGSIQEILAGTESWRARVINKLTNTVLLNTINISPKDKREFICFINTRHPKLIIAYADAIYDLAKFAEKERLAINPPGSIITSAGTLFPFMRKTIESVFLCPVFDRYGSREVGDVACECCGLDGLWVAPWGNYIEIVDSKGNRVPDGVEGDILVTSLTNYAMPLIRYKIGDRGILASNRTMQVPHGQVLEKIQGRSNDMIIKKGGETVHFAYFVYLLFYKDWIAKYQIVQKDYTWINYRIVKSEVQFNESDIEDIVRKTRLVMGEECEVTFEFIDEIPTCGSGKFRYIISEIPRNQESG